MDGSSFDSHPATEEEHAMEGEMAGGDSILTAPDNPKGEKRRKARRKKRNSKGTSEVMSKTEVMEYIRKKGIIFRVNCLDCLDRTNLAQYMLFSYFLPHDLEVLRHMWKRNGNALSNFYTGSDALKAELSNKGKLSLMGRMNDLLISAKRMIKNTFSDKMKQRCIDVLLGRM